MTTLKINLADVGGRPVSATRAVFLSAPAHRPSVTVDGRVVTTTPYPIDVVAGLATVTVEPGELVVEIRSGLADSIPKRVTVPDGDDEVTLEELLESAYVYDPPVISEVQRYRNEIVASTGAAARSEANALAHMEAAESSATNAGNSATAALAHKDAAGDSATDAEAARAAAFLERKAAELAEANALAHKNAAGVSATNAGASAAAALTNKNAAGTFATEAEASRAAAFLERKAAELARDQTQAGGVPDNGVTTLKLRDDAVTLPKIPVSARQSIARMPEVNDWWHDVLAFGSQLGVPVQEARTISVGSGGTGGALTDVTAISFTATNGYASKYHLYAAGLDWSKPVGLVVHFHGDGAFEYTNPTSAWSLGGASGLIAQAKARNMVLVVPLTPDDAVGRLTWWEWYGKEENPRYAKDLIAYLMGRYNLDRKKIWLSGFSGGSQFITRYLLPHFGVELGILGGGFIVFGGGGAPATSFAPYDPTFKSGWHCRWVAGANDNGSEPGDGFNAIEAANAGAAWYAAQGFATEVTLIPGKGHDLDGLYGPNLGAEIDARPPKGDWATVTTDVAPFAHLESSKTTLLPADSLQDAVRYTWNHSSVAFTSVEHFVVSYTYVGTARTVVAAVEQSTDGIAWTVVGSSTATQGVNNVIITIPTWGSATFMRLTFTRTSGTAAVAVGTIQALTNRKGDQGSGKELAFPFKWTKDRAILFGATDAGIATKFRVGDNTTNQQGGMQFGTDTFFYRSAAGALKTPGYITVGRLYADNSPGAANELTRKDYVDAADALLAPKVHKHSAADIDSGTLPVARGGIGRGDLVDGSYMRGAGTGAVQMRTPAQVLADIGGAPVVHDHPTKADLVNGLIPQAQLPAIALTDFLGEVASQAAMLALVGQRGDWCSRADRGTDWQLIAEPSTVLANWRERMYPASPVSSVAGRNGAVTLSVADVSGAVGTSDSRLSDARSPLGTTQTVWNAGTANAANFGITPAELRAATVAAIAATDPKPHTHPASAITATAWHLARVSTTATASLTAGYRATYAGLIDSAVQVSGAGAVSVLAIGEVAIPTTGWYMLTANIKFGTAPATAGSYALISQSATTNGTKTEIAMGQQSVAGQNVVGVTTIAYLTAGTFVNPGFYIASTGTVTGSADGSATSFRGVLIGV
ncbi:hypothetical protein R4P64_07660 [Rhodococcus sp. IEGM 1366]|uniref:hypothetical protein n=1 Tax=Rhodococcus sp. IEGM 1366 TaxID=3082223 RepID=UPI002955243C|nr:hypothetical protein [Rhodococcus sp. IEGM 1366]MDV8066377.1 hypothetical protein [Rhodococcus sp. IEGM 1366]